MLVSALAGREFILKAYNEAVEQKYRFFSFGRCNVYKIGNFSKRGRACFAEKVLL